MSNSSAGNSADADQRTFISTGDTNADDQGATFIPTSPDSSGDVPNTKGSKATSDANAKPAAKASAGDAKQPAKTVNQLGEFKLVKKLGQGGMGEVYLATQVGLDRKVAIKVLAKQFAKKPDFVQRFYREARSMAKLDHPHIVRCYSVGEDKGVHYVAIEFIDGSSMQNWMDKLGKLSIGDAMHCVLVAAEALHHAHELGLIHRDVKPDNMLVTTTGILKVSDMGLAKAQDEDVSMTQSGTGMGTPLYMAPEQARNAKHVDLRTDIYALGCSLYYFLTGKLPFTGENAMELIVAKEKGTFSPARRLNSEIPERLDLIIDKMISKNPAHRYASCAEVIRDLEALGLDNPSLSFISETGVEAASRATSANRRGGTTAVPHGATQAPASARASQIMASHAKPAAAPEPAASESPGQLWYVRYSNTEGKVVIAKMTSAQVKQAIRSGLVDLRAKASLTSNGDFRPLAQYAEFESAMKGLAVKTKTDHRSQGLAAEFQKLDRQHGRRKYWRMLQNFIQSTMGAFSLIIYLAVLAAVGYFGFLYIPKGYEFVAGKLGLGPKATAPATPGTPTPNAPQQPVQ
ncbi:MAG: serine/threonine protein kinase [Planctomycetaceae bacterium]